MQQEIDSKTSFHVKEVVALLLVVAISLTIFLFRDSLEDLAALGYMGVFLVALLGSATFLLPAPALILVFIAGGTLSSPLLVGVLAGVGSTLGELTGYLAGLSGSGLFEKSKLHAKIKGFVAHYGAWAIALMALIPNPLFDLAGMAAGVLKMKWRTFLLATLAGKVLKMLLVAYAGSLSIDWVRQLLL